jgi:multiple sugar transport system substrate-binding protein
MICPRLNPSQLRATAIVLLAGAAFIGTLKTSSCARAADKITISVAYGETYVFDTEDLTKKWWGGIKSQFESKFPNVTLKLVPIGGGYDDITNKLSLLYRSHATTPDVAQIATPVISQFAASEYLLPLDGYLTKEHWWKQFPPVIQSEGTYEGRTYAVNTGENDSQLYYNINLFKQVGLPVPWTPHNWNDIIAAARVFKAKLPSVVPLWINTGTSSGDNGILTGAGNLLAGSTMPTMYDMKTGKWVVDSAGLREVLGFYHSIFSEGMGAHLSDLFSTASVTIPTTLIPEGKIAITFGQNFYGGQWSKLVCAPCWADAPRVEGIVPIPTINGQNPKIATKLAGWDIAVAAVTKHPQYAWELVNLIESESNQIDIANWAGFVPANTDYVKAPAFVEFAPPFNEVSAQVLPYGVISPNNADYLIWSHGLQEATGALAQHPDMSVDTALSTMKDYIVNQLDPSDVETLK